MQVCTSILVGGDKSACNSDAELFYKAVSNKEQSAFDQARRSCSTSSPAQSKLLVQPELEKNQDQLNGISVALVLDRSGSMKDEKKLSKAIQAAKAFAMTMDDADQISISSFSDKGSTQQGTSSVINVKDKIESVLSLIKPSGGTKSVLAWKRDSGSSVSLKLPKRLHYCFQTEQIPQNQIIGLK